MGQTREPRGEVTNDLKAVLPTIKVLLPLHIRIIREDLSASEASSLEEIHHRSWVEIVNARKPSLIMLLTALHARAKRAQERLKESTRRLQTTQNRQDRESSSEPAAIYFSNVMRGPIGAMKKELRSVMPLWSILCLEFIGESFLELVIDTAHREKVTTIMCILGYKPLAISSPLENICKSTSNLPAPVKARINVRMCLRRAPHMGKRHRSPLVQRFYSTMDGEARKALEELPLLDVAALAKVSAPELMEIYKPELRCPFKCRQPPQRLTT